MKKIYLIIFSNIFLITASFAQALTVTAVPSAASCAQGNNGSVTINCTGGTPPYMYTLDGSTYQSSNVFTGFQANFYIAGVLDAASNWESVTFTIADGDSLHASPVIIPPSCTGSQDAMISFTFADGVGPWTVSNVNWGSGSTMGTPADGWWGINPPGNYDFRVIDQDGCVGRVVTTIPDGIAAATHAGDDAAICSGGTIQLSGSGNGTMLSPHYEWSPSNGLDYPSTANPIAAPAVTTTYTLTTKNQWFASNITCVTSDVVTITVVDVQTPVVVVNDPTLSVSNPQASVTYTWQQLNGNTWDDIATGTSYTPTSNHEYRVKASSGSCENYSASQTAGRMAGTNAFGIALFPNPTANVLNLYDLKPEYNWQTLDIINAQGLRVIPTTGIRNMTSFSTNISRLNSGIYIVKLTKADGGTAEIRFIKQ
ncbi:MAG: T9SS type A sorting domain-containing protein [Ferruginibacter sp.]